MMMKTTRFLAILLSLSLMGSRCFAEPVKRTAKIIEVSGTVEAKIAKAPWAAAAEGMVLNESDLIRTRTNSFCILNLNGKGETATVEVKENTQMRLAELVVDKTEDLQTTLLDVALGEILIKAEKVHTAKSKFEVKTPTSIVAVRGTKFSVSVKAGD